MRTDLALQTRIVQAEVREGLPAKLQQQIIDQALVLPRQLAQLVRQREGDHEVVHRQQLGTLPFQPLLPFMMLTVRTVAMAAGMRQRLALPARRAAHHQHRTVLGAARLHGRERPFMTGQETPAITRAQVTGKLSDQPRQQDHTASSRRRLNGRRSASSRAVA